MSHPCGITRVNAIKVNSKYYLKFIAGIKIGVTIQVTDKDKFKVYLIKQKYLRCAVTRISTIITREL
jgi:hypothetical protein